MHEESRLDCALYSAEQARELDNVAINRYGFSGISLMKSAGERAFTNIMQLFADTKCWVVLCGPGNNGGDGYVVANCAQSIGLKVAVVQSSQPKTENAVEVCREYIENGGEIGDVDFIQQADLVVDGLLGTGIKLAPAGEIADLISLANASDFPIVSLDAPSGLDSDSGFAFEPCIRAAMTVTFIGRKFGMYTGSGRQNCGSIRYEGLNLPKAVFDHVTPAAELIGKPTLSTRGLDSHKGSYGNVVIAGGDLGMLGAVLLAGRSALRTGAGLVTILTHHSHLCLPALHCAELMSQCFESVSQYKSLLDRCDVIVLGPGLGQNEWSEKAFHKLLTSEKLMVVDADGLNWLARFPQKRDNWILTPHPGEAARLLDCTTREVQHDRKQAANAISDRYGGVCILKGAGTLVAYRCGIWVCDCGNPGMATAGMGDVLSGIVAALLGQNYSLIDAAKTATWLHSYSADKAVERIGSNSLLAGDVIDTLPDVIRSLYDLAPTCLD